MASFCKMPLKYYAYFGKASAPLLFLAAMVYGMIGI